METTASSSSTSDVALMVKVKLMDANENRKVGRVMVVKLTRLSSRPGMNLIAVYRKLPIAARADLWCTPSCSKIEVDCSVGVEEMAAIALIGVSIRPVIDLPALDRAILHAPRMLEGLARASRLHM